MKISTLLLVLSLVLAGCGDMIITPNPANGTWDSFTAPSDGNAKAAVSVDVPLQALADKAGYLETGNSLVFADLGATHGGTGRKVEVDGLGWFRWTAALIYPSPFNAPLVPYIVAGAAPEGGFWVWDQLAMHAFNKLPLIGPGPNDGVIYPGVTTNPGKLNRSIIDHGYFMHVAGGPGTFVTASTTLTTIHTIAALGLLKQHDLVRLEGSLVAECTDGFQMAVYFSTDAGSTWTSALGGLPHFSATGAGRNILVPFSFSLELAGDTAGSFTIATRGMVDSAVNLSVTESNWIVRVDR